MLVAEAQLLLLVLLVERMLEAVRLLIGRLEGRMMVIRVGRLREQPVRGAGAHAARVGRARSARRHLMLLLLLIGDR